MIHWHKTEGYVLHEDWPSQPLGEGTEQLMLAGRITEAVELCLLVQQVVTDTMVRRNISEFATITDKYDFRIADLGKAGTGLLVDLGQDSPYQWLFSRVPLPAKT